MRKIFWLVVVIVILTSTAAWAAEAVKIGFIDLQSALLESDAGKKAKADLAALEKSKKAVIDEKVKSIKNLEEEISKQSSVLSAEAKKVKEDELEREQRDFQRQVQDARAELQKKENELTEAILKDMSEVVEEFGKEEGYSVILRSEVMLYAKKEHDLTDVIVKRFNESKKKLSDVRRNEKEESKEKPKERSKNKK